MRGLSSGGHYALTCAAQPSDRVTAAAVVEGETDFAWAGAWDGYAEYEATLMRIGDEDRGAACARLTTARTALASLRSCKTSRQRIKLHLTTRPSRLR